MTRIALKTHPMSLVTPVVLAIAAVGLLAAWHGHAARTRQWVGLREPIDHNRGAARATAEETPPDRLVKGHDGEPADIPGSWPQFRGADRSGVATYGQPLARSWPEGGPPVLWRTEVGEGYAGPAIHGGRVYLLDYDRDAQENALRCLSLADGREFWRYTFAVRVKRNHGMSRTVVAVGGGYVVGIGPLCNVRCLDAETGELAWAMDMVRQYGTTVPPWYTGQCPLIDGDRVILAPGADPFMMAVELSSGEVLWRTPNPGGWAMTHSSIVPAEFGGVRQYVYCGSRGVLSVAADDGRLLWRWDGWRIAIATSPSPVVVGEDRLLFTGDYGAGSQMIRVTAEAEDDAGGETDIFAEAPPKTFTVEKLWELPSKQFACKQQTPVLRQGLLYTVRPDGRVVCADAEGSVLWASEAAVSTGWAPFMFVDDIFLALSDETGELIAAEADRAGFLEIARAKVIDGQEAWAPMAFAGGRLIVRDMHEMVCLDLRAGAEEGGNE